MAQREWMQALVAELETKAAHDAQVLESACACLEERRRGVDEAEERVRSASRRATASAEALSEARSFAEQLDAEAAPVAPEADGQPAAPQPSATLTVVEDIRRFLRQVGQASTKEIIAHVGINRPGAKSSNVSPELSRLVKRGHIVRVSKGVYRLVRCEEERAAG
ncbi:type IV toxin-antitoxin system AbiEi family antitoxin domain-containing protein [Streptomyces demainii]|uniref:Coiled-coil protein SlyX n=1 Tax=Streptomyces demainii TaxID=588122 RepID=A0ABT9KWS3_9ACTN|nr:type IV toxin-antitoxin system AbiEi family antitoxin domain-containing protein [Streptomyces demainii]MDP9612867.1 putative coiled-coil protein SlyX [Streptomyces demainii]